MKRLARRAVQVAVGLWLLVGGAAFAGTLYGEVVIEAAPPHAVKLSFIDERGYVTTVTTNAKGHYEVSLPPGAYRVESDAGAVSPATIEVFHEPRQQKIVVAEAK